MHTSTWLSQSPTVLRALLSRLSKSYVDHSILFSLSVSTSSAIPVQDLSSLVNCLTTFSHQTVGCLSRPLPGSYSNFISCSVAVFDPTEAVPFRSTTPGRASPQVGRWHSFRKKDDDDQTVRYDLDNVHNNWSELWDRSSGENKLPVELRGLKLGFAVKT